MKNRKDITLYPNPQKKHDTMKRKMYASVMIILMNLVAVMTYAQNQSDQAKTYFSSYLSSESMEKLILQSLPTLEDCQSVFEGQHAETYFRSLEEMKSKPVNKPNEGNETFADLRIEYFSTSDIQQGKGNYAGGMERIVDKLQTGVIFYKVSLLRKKGDEYGLALNYWVWINGRWVFFPKPYAAFER